MKNADASETPALRRRHDKLKSVVMPFNQLCPGCAARRLEMSAAPCAVCGRVNAVEAPIRARKPHFSARLLRWLLLPMGRWWHGFLALALLLALRQMSVNWVLPFFSWFSLFAGLLWFFLIILWSIKLLTRVIIWLVQRGEKKRRPGWKSFATLPVCVLLILALDFTKLPLRVAFWLSRPSLDRVRQQLPSRRLLNLQRRAGLYTVRQLHKSRDATRLEVTDNILFSGIKAGFAFCPDGCGTVNFPSSFIDMSSGKPNYTALSHNWYWWQQEGSDF